MIHKTSVVASGQKNRNQEDVFLKDCFQRMIAEMATKRALLGTDRNKICHNETFPLIEIVLFRNGWPIVRTLKFKKL